MGHVKHKDIQHRDAAALAAGYTSGLRVFDWFSIVSWSLVMAGVAFRLGPALLESPWLAVSAIAAGYLLADFISGFVHWMADSWGSVDMPLVGKALLRPFREHHVDAKAITRHDFVETNGNNCFISLAPALACLLLPIDGPLWLFGVVTVASLVVWIFLTNQFHKWSHVDEPPALVDLLQRAHLILPRGHHDHHHRAPYNRTYCITAGWMNYPLDAVRFFPLMEKLVTAVTGMLPRQDDIGELAARMVAEAQAREEAQRALTAHGTRAH
ncbi:MAG: hypothetical protein RL653_4025 [Pseudomonadota bacterium]|jgi:hypothetical protein